MSARATGAPEWFLELKGGKSKQTFCPIIKEDCVGILCKCCETRSHTWIKDPPNGDGNYHSGEYYYCSKLDLAIPDEDATGWQRSGGTLERWLPDYHPIPDEILNDPLDLTTFNMWFWNSETGIKHKARYKEASG